MGTADLLPRRRQAQPRESHDAAFAGVLATPPVAPLSDGLAIVSRIGSRELLPFLVAAKSVHRRLARGRFVIVDDGTLAGADRTVLAGHLGNPEILSPRAVPLGGFPPGLGWEPLLAAFDRRRGEYWLVLDPFAIATGALTEIEGALGANRSLAGGAALTGLAAGGPARPDAAALFEALGEATAPASAAHELLMAREAAPVVLGQEPGIVRFGPEEAPSHAEAALPAIAELGRSG